LVLITGWLHNRLIIGISNPDLNDEPQIGIWSKSTVRLLDGLGNLGLLNSEVKIDAPKDAHSYILFCSYLLENDPHQNYWNYFASSVVDSELGSRYVSQIEEGFDERYQLAIDVINYQKIAVDWNPFIEQGIEKLQQFQSRSPELVIGILSTCAQL